MERQENWFSRHRTFIFGFAVVIVLLNLALFLLVPQQRAIVWEGEATEYAVDAEDFAELRTVKLDAVLTTSILGGTSLDGTLTISGHGLTETPFHLERQNRRWVGSFRDASGQPRTTEVHEIYSTKELETIVIDFWTHFDQTDTQTTAALNPESAHFLALDATSRQAALRQYQ